MSTSHVVDPGAPRAQRSPKQSVWHSSAIWLPPSLAATLLLIIAATSVWLTRRIDRQRNIVADLETASRSLKQFEISFLDEVAAWRTYQIQPLESTLGQVRRTQLITQGNLERVEQDGGRIGTLYGRGLAELRHTLREWEEAPLSILSDSRPANGAKQVPPERVDLASSLVTKAAELDRWVARERRAQGDALRSSERLRLILLGALFPVALLSVILTALSTRRAALTKQRGVRNEEYEALLRDTMAALAGEKVFPAALGRIASNAMRLGMADGAFIEQTDAERDDVEIAAAAGTGTLHSGARIAFPDSITSELIRTGVTQLIADLHSPTRRFERLAQEGWQHCFAVAVPLLDKGDVVGALVVVSRRAFSAREETVARLQPLAAWAALALHRQSLFHQLNAERARLEAVIREMPVGVVMADAPSGRVSMFNRHAVDLWGSPPRVPQSIDEYANWRLLHPGGGAYATKQRPLARSILKGELVQSEEALIERVDGTRRTVLLSSAPVRDEGGGIIAAVGTVSDITEEKRRAAEAHFLDEISRQLASTLDYDATINAVLHLLVPRLADAVSVHHRLQNKLIRSWAAATSDPKVTQIFQDIDSEYPLPLPSPHPVAVAIRTGIAQLREVVDDDMIKLVARDDRELEWLRSLGLQSVMAVPMTVRGRTNGALCIISVTPSHHFNCNDLAFAEEVGRRVALAVDNAKLFRSVNRSARVSRFLADAAHSLSESLEPAEVLRRVTRLAVPFFADFAIAYGQNKNGEVVPMAWAHEDSTKEQLLAEAAPLFLPEGSLGKSMSRAMDTGEPHLVANPAAETRDNETPRVREVLELLSPISWIIVPLVARAEAHGAMMLAVVHPERRFQADDVALCQRLASRVALAMQNATFYQNIQEALRTRDEVLAVVSHDLRNPLQTIGLSVELLQELPPDEALRRKQLDRIARAKDLMDRLIQDLLDVVRLEGGKSISFDCRNESPSSFITETCESFVGSANEKGVRLSWNVPKGLPYVWADSGRIVQVLSNLLANALKFTPQGGQIDVQVEEQKGTVVVHVRDTGVGIPQEDLGQIFHAFWQAPRNTRLGAGLGLAISRGIIEQHGGRISVKSKEGAGATFTFTLPVAREQGEAQAAD